MSGLAHAVLAHRRDRHRTALYGGLAIALALHAGALLWARGVHERMHEPARAPAPDTEIELGRPTPPLPEETPEPPARAEPPSRRTAPPRAVTHAAPRAQAAAVVAREPDVHAPLDFSGADFVTGTANAYAGGVTAASGTSASAVPRAPAAQSVPAGPERGTTMARPVTLAEEEWQCPWPHEAEREQIDEQTVTLRAQVAADGRVLSVTLLQDPGYGFGAAARACAFSTRFSPALDAGGRPTSARSPPIRLHFTR